LGAWQGKGSHKGAAEPRYKKIAGNYNFDTSQTLVPSAPDAEVYTHHFGVYASLTPSENLGLTLGYAGIFTKYLDEFYRGGAFVKTLNPSILQSGINVNMRYKGVPRLTLRTDHNFSFWTDRDYRSFGITGWPNVGLLSQAGANTSGEVSHWLLWNGAGAVYDLSKRLELSVYVHNLYRNDEASGGGSTYTLTRDNFAAEPKITWRLNEEISVFGGVTLDCTLIGASKDLNAQGLNSFKSGSGTKETTDTDPFVITIPVGITINF